MGLGKIQTRDCGEVTAGETVADHLCPLVSLGTEFQSEASSVFIGKPRSGIFT